MWFLLLMYLLNLLILLIPHPISLLITHINLLGRTFAIIAKSIVILSLRVADYSLSNLQDKTLYFGLLVFLLLLLLKNLSKVSLLKSTWKIFNLFYNNFSQTQVNLPHKFYLSPQVPLHYCISIMPVAIIWPLILLILFPKHVLFLYLLFIL